MSTYDKLIKQATKPKQGAIKPKYIDPIIAASFSQDGSLQDICKSLQHRLQDSSSLVVFRSLIVIHTLVRNGGVDNVLSCISSSHGSLKLRNVTQGGNWQGYDAPRMLAPYAAYLDERIKVYRELRHDVIRASGGSAGGSERSRRGANGDRSEGAESGLRLRKLTVDKGLLREVAICQKVCSRLLELFFSYFSDNVYDELSLTAFRMSLKDLLAIYAAINEGVINVLEHYFEMSKVDATAALDIYKRFCAHTEKIVAYLASARKVSSTLNMTVPNIRHAPVSLAGALKEYLDDPNFEKNRKEYKENKRIADGGGTSKPSATADKNPETGSLPASASKKSITIQEPTAEEKAKPIKPPTENQALQDFFESIETNQMSMFGANAQQQGFIMPQATGYQPQMPMMAPQMTGYNPFYAQQQAPMGGNGMFLQTQQTGFMQPQITGFAAGGFLNPQMTGMANPFRQSSLPPGASTMNFGGQANNSLDAFNAAFGGNGTTPALQANNGQASAPATQTTTSLQPASSPAPTPASSIPPAVRGTDEPPRSSSAPLIAQKTGSRNPFAPPPGSTPPPPKAPAGAKGPTLFELAFGAGGGQGPTAGGGGNYGLGANAWNGNGTTNGAQQQQQQQQQPQPQPPAQSGLVPQKTGLIGSIASEFVTGNGLANNAGTPSNVGGNSQSPAPDANASVTNGFAGLSLGGSNGGVSSPLASPNPLQPQPTGFGGSLVQPFKPESSFGQTLAGGGPTSPLPAHLTGNPFAQLPKTNSAANPTPPTGTPGASTPTPAGNGVNTQPTGLGQSLFASSSTPQTQQPMATGFGSSLFPSTSAAPNGGLASQPTGFAGSTVRPFQPTSAFGSVAFGSGSVLPPQQQQQQQQSQQAPQSNVVTGSLF